MNYLDKQLLIAVILEIIVISITCFILVKLGIFLNP